MSLTPIGRGAHGADPHGPKAPGNLGNPYGSQPTIYGEYDGYRDLTPLNSWERQDLVEREHLAQPLHHVVSESRDMPETGQRPPNLRSLPPKREVTCGYLPTMTPAPWIFAALSALVTLTFLPDGPWPYTVITFLCSVGVIAFKKIVRSGNLKDYERESSLADASWQTADSQVELYNARETGWWEWTRPLNVISRERLRHPLDVLHMYTHPNDLNFINGTPERSDGMPRLYLGVGRESEAFVTVPRDRPVLVLMPTRRGKTTRVVIPALLGHTGPAVVVSTKPDILEPTAGARACLGKIWMFNPFEESYWPDGVLPVRFSPLQGVTNWDTALKISVAMIGATPIGGEGSEKSGGAYWVEAANEFLPLLLFAAFLKGYDMTRVRRWVHSGELVEIAEIIEEVTSDPTHPHYEGAVIAYEAVESIGAYDDRHFHSIRGTVSAALRVYNNTAVSRNCKAADFDVASFVQSRDTLYIVGAAEDQAMLAPIIASLLEQIQLAVNDFNRQKPFMEDDRPSTLVMIDEAANNAPVKALPRYVSEGGSKGLQIVMCLQTLAQAELPWPTQGKSLFSYFGMVLASGGLSDSTTLEALSVLCGDEYREYVSETEGTSDSYGSSQQWTEGTSRDEFSFRSSTSVSFSRGSTASHGVSSGTTSSQQKQRRMSQADIATIPYGQALLVGDGRWQIINLRGLENPGWAQIASYSASPGSLSHSRFEDLRWEKDEDGKLWISSAEHAIDDCTHRSEETVRSVPKKRELLDKVSDAFEAPYYIGRTDSLRYPWGVVKRHAFEASAPSDKVA